MRLKLLLLIFVFGGVESVEARSFQTGHFVMTLTDKNSMPITDATVHVKTLNRTGLTAGVYRGHYTTFSAQTDTNGVADVTFSFLTSHFTWWLDTPSHHSKAVGFKSDFLVSEVVKSDYWDSETNTVEGLVRYNELKALDEAGDYVSYVEKFEPKSVTYVSNTIHKSLSFYPKRNPQPMYAYGDKNAIDLPENEIRTETNGYVVISCPTVSVDLERCSLLPPFGDGVTADFSLERYCVETNGVQEFYGRMVFSPGCGAYRSNKTLDNSFPSTYEADLQNRYESVVDFRTVRDLGTGRIMSSQRLLGKDEYMVLRTRLDVSDSGNTNGWHYSKILGPIRVRSELSFDQLVYNPRLNDRNLELDVNENLAGSRGESRWP